MLKIWENVTFWSYMQIFEVYLFNHSKKTSLSKTKILVTLKLPLYFDKDNKCISEKWVKRWGLCAQRGGVGCFLYKKGWASTGYRTITYHIILKLH